MPPPRATLPPNKGDHHETRRSFARLRACIVARRARQRRSGSRRGDQGDAAIDGPLPRFPRQPRTVGQGSEDRRQARRRRAESGVQGHRECRRHRRRRGHGKRPRSGGADPRRHGRAAGDRSDRPALRVQGPRNHPRRRRDRRHARLRPRYAHGELDRHAEQPGGDEGSMVGHGGDDRPACRGNRPGRARYAGRRALYALSQACPRARLPRQRRSARRGDRPALGLCAGERRFGRYQCEGHRRPRCLSAHHQGSDRARCADRRFAPDFGVARTRPAGPRRRYRGIVSGGIEAQHHR